MNAGVAGDVHITEGAGVAGIRRTLPPAVRRTIDLLNGAVASGVILVLLTLTSVRILSSTKDFDFGQKEQLVGSGFQTGLIVALAGHFVDELQHAFQVRGKLVQ